jgi:TPR repeat protein
VLSQIEKLYCTQGSAWACNDLALLETSGRAAQVMPPKEAFERACALQMPAGCANRSLFSATTTDPPAARAFLRAPPAPIDYPILLQEGQGRLEGLFPAELYGRACLQGWSDGCVRLAGVHFLAAGGDRDVPRAVSALERACSLKVMSACADVGVILQEGDGVPSDPDKGRSYLKRACDGGFRKACSRLESPGQGRGGG